MNNKRNLLARFSKASADKPYQPIAPEVWAKLFRDMDRLTTLILKEKPHYD